MTVEDELAQLRRQLAQAVGRVCPTWLADQREDIVQVAILRVAHILEQAEGKRPLPSSYLWKVAYTATIDEIRRHRGRREVVLDAIAPGEASSGSTEDPQRLIAAHETGRAIRRCLRRLSPSRARAVTLHLQGHSVPEAARLLGWGEKAMENLVYRGLADLRSCLTSHGIVP